MNPHGEFIKKEDCLLLLVDIQETLLRLCRDNERVVVNVDGLIDAFIVLDVPMIFSVHYGEKLGPFLPELTQKVRDPRVLHKVEFSCLKNPPIFRALEESGRRTLVLAGLETHICIFQTAVHALKEGYRVHVLADAVTSRGEANQEVGLRRMEKAGAVISSTEMVIFELLERAATPEFRRVLPVLKSF